MCLFGSYLLTLHFSGYGSQTLRASSAWSKTEEFNETAVSATNHLIVVAGHSVTISGNVNRANVDESAWFLYDYMKGKGLPQAITGHLRAGIAEARRDGNSLLVFSGGETRSAVGPISEGGSYYRVADALGLWEEGVRSRTATEEYATDSFQNL